MKHQLFAICAYWETSRDVRLHVNSIVANSKEQAIEAYIKHLNAPSNALLIATPISKEMMKKVL